MKIAEALTLLSEFPDQVFARYITKEGDFDMEALFSSYNSIQIGEKLAKLGYTGLDYKDAVLRLKIRIFEYLAEQGKIFESLEEDMQEDAEIKAEKSAYIEPDYRILIKILVRMGSMGNFDYNVLTLFDAHNIVNIDLPPKKTVEQLQSEVKALIEVENENVRKSRQSIWDGQTEHDKNDKAFLKHIIKSMENGDI